MKLHPFLRANLKECFIQETLFGKVLARWTDFFKTYFKEKQLNS